MSKVTRWLTLSVVCAVVIGVAATAATARTSVISVTTGSTPPLISAIDDPIFQTSQASNAYALTRQAGATYARLIVVWRTIAPTTLPTPSSLFHATDPNSPYYSWSALDASVSAALANGVQPILDIVGPPKWGYHVPRGTWTGGQPDIGMLGDFAKALASHYPAVHAFSVWNEPNFNRNLDPQDPTYFRSMVNAVADSVHQVNPSNLALAGELAPFKHAKTKTDPNNVVPPITWMQKMLCLSTTKPYHLTCPAGSAHFDVWTHHPYSDTGPYGHARVAGGVELGDLPKMNSLLQAAWNLGAIQSSDPSGNSFPFWVTEIGWSTNPPNKHGAPIKLVTRWVAESFYQLWKSGATLGTWFLLQDQPSSTPLQSGLYTNSPTLATATPKSLLTPFAFPFVAYLKSGGKVQVWGRDTTSDSQPVEIDMKVGSKWKQVATITANNYGIFTAKLSVHAVAKYSMRASAPGSGTSATFALTVPSNENMNVVPFPFN